MCYCYEGSLRNTEQLCVAPISEDAICCIPAGEVPYQRKEALHWNRQVKSPQSSCTHIRAQGTDRGSDRAAGTCKRTRLATGGAL